MPETTEPTESSSDEKIDRKSILRSTVPKRKSRIPVGFSGLNESQPSNKFLDLIQYYECLDHLKNKSVVKPSLKDKGTASCSTSTTPDLPEYESSSTGTRSTATPDLIYPGLPKSTSSVISESGSDCRDESPDFGYTSIHKPRSQDYEDNATSSSDSRNMSPEYGYRNIPQKSSQAKSQNKCNSKLSESPDLGYGTAPEKETFQNYTDMRYLLDLKSSQSSDSESNSGPKSDSAEETMVKNDDQLSIRYLFNSDVKGNNDDEFKHLEELAKSNDFSDYKYFLEMEERDAKRSSIYADAIIEISRQTEERKQMANSNDDLAKHIEHQNSIDKWTMDITSMLDHEVTIRNVKLFSESEASENESNVSEKNSYSNVFEYTAPKHIVTIDNSRYKLAFDITESDFSLNMASQADDEADDMSSRRSFYASKQKMLSRSNSDGYQYDDEIMRKSFYESKSADRKESTDLDSTAEYNYDDILDPQIMKEYETRESPDTANDPDWNTLNLDLKTPYDAKLGDIDFNYSAEFKLDTKCSDNIFNTDSKTASQLLSETNYEFVQDKRLSQISNDSEETTKSISDHISDSASECNSKTESTIEMNAIEQTAGSNINESSKLNSSKNAVPETHARQEIRFANSPLIFEYERKSETDSSINTPISQDVRSDSRSDISSESGMQEKVDDNRPESQNSCGFGNVQIPDSYEPQLEMPEIRPRYSLLDDSRSNITEGILSKSQSDLNTRHTLDPRFFSKTNPKFPTTSYKYPLPKPSDFLSESFNKTCQNQSLNLSAGLSDSRHKAMRSFMTSCIDDTNQEKAPELPRLPPPQLHKDNKEHHRMKIDLHTVDYIMNNRRKSLKRDQSDFSKELADDENFDDANYSIVSLIGALEELGIEVEFSDIDEQHRRRTMGRNTSLMESVREEDESEMKEIKDEMKREIKQQMKSQLNQIKEAEEVQGTSESANFCTPPRRTEQKQCQVLSDCGKESAQESHVANENATDVEHEEEQHHDHNITTNSLKMDRPSSPVISSSKKLKFLRRRPQDVGASSLSKPNDLQNEQLQRKNNLESTRHLFTDSVNNCKLDNSLSTISTATTVSHEVSPVADFKESKVDKTSSLAPTNLFNDAIESTSTKNRPTINAEFDKLEKYAKVVKSGKVGKSKRNSFTTKYRKALEEKLEKVKQSRDVSEAESIPPVVENFLSVALGSEKDKYETTEADESLFSNTNDIDFTDSNLFTPDQSTSNIELDEPTSFKQSLSNLTSSAKAAIKNATRRKKSAERQNWYDLKEEMHVLLDSVNKQQLMIQQASKALKMCYTFKEFKNSEEHVESERILLLAHKRKIAAMEAIDKFTQKTKSPKYDNYGDITLSNIVIPLNINEKQDKSLKQNSKHDFVEWYMVVVQYGLTVLASQPVMRQKNTNQIIIPDPFVLPKVAPDFQINFEIYRLKLKKKGDISHELKYHIHGNYSLADSWYKAIAKLTQRSNQSKNSRMRLTKMFESSFIYIGHLELTLKDLSVTSPWVLKDAHLILEGTVNMSFFCKVDLTVSNAGWLTHGTDLKGYTVWNRRWCVLVGHVLKFWDYPTDDPKQPPIMTLDLIHCKDSEIGIADRELCAKPRTIMLEFLELKSNTDYDNENDSNVVEQRNFLTLDTNRDLNEWLTKINGVLQALKNWNAKS